MASRNIKLDKVELAVGVLLLLAIVAAFGQTVRHEFVNFDDNDYVYANSHVSRGLSGSGVVWAFTHSQNTNWIPLTWLSLMVDCQLYDLHAGGHHLTSVLLHAATAVLLFLVLRRMTGRLWPSALVARLVCRAPAAGGVGGLGDGTQGRPQRTVLHAGALGLPRLRARAVFTGPVRMADRRVCPGAFGQADARDASLRAPAVGLLAAGADGGAFLFSTDASHRPPRSRSNAPPLQWGGFPGTDFSRATPGGSAPTAIFSSRKSPCLPWRRAIAS